jgi:general nucleoside transport system ATP-binding protein
VGAQAAVWEELRNARALRRGHCADLGRSRRTDRLSDTLLVMLRGKFVATLDPATVTPRDLGSYMTGATVAS